MKFYTMGVHGLVRDVKECVPEEVTDENKNQTNCLYNKNSNKDVLRALLGLEEDLSIEWYCF